MQTDDEADTAVHRGNAENVALAGAVSGIDVIFAGHTDAGTTAPIVHPDTGTLIMQTFGQGQHLGFLQIELDEETGERVSYHGSLMPVVSNDLRADAQVTAKLAAYRAQHAAVYERVGRTSAPLVHRYYEESDLGNLFADIVREHSGAQIGLMPLRKDLPGGDVSRVDLLDAFPFEDRVATMDMPGHLLLQIIEQGLSLERGMLQVSGLQVEYYMAQPSGNRIVRAIVDREPLNPAKVYAVATLEILAQGGDAYVRFKEVEQATMSNETFADVLEAYFTAREEVNTPLRGRLRSVEK